MMRYEHLWIVGWIPFLLTVQVESSGQWIEVDEASRGTWNDRSSDYDNIQRTAGGWSKRHERGNRQLHRRHGDVVRIDSNQWRRGLGKKEKSKPRSDGGEDEHHKQAQHGGKKKPKASNSKSKSKLKQGSKGKKTGGKKGKSVKEKSGKGMGGKSGNSGMMMDNIFAPSYPSEAPGVPSVTALPSALSPNQLPSSFQTTTPITPTPTPVLSIELPPAQNSQQPQSPTNRPSSTPSSIDRQPPQPRPSRPPTTIVPPSTVPPSPPPITPQPTPYPGNNPTSEDIPTQEPEGLPSSPSTSPMPTTDSDSPATMRPDVASPSTINPAAALPTAPTLIEPTLEPESRPSSPSTSAMPTTDSDSPATLRPDAASPSTMNPAATLPTAPTLIEPTVLSGVPSLVIVPSLVPTTTNETNSDTCPVIPEDGCSVCGEGLCVTSPETMVLVPNQTILSCGALEEAGLNGTLHSFDCNLFSTIISTVCGCEEKERETPSPASSPVTDGSPSFSVQPTAAAPSAITTNATSAPSSSDSFFFCDVCGEGNVIRNPEAIVPLPNGENTSCFIIADQGADGLIPPDRCDALVQNVAAACGCVPRYSTCLACGIGSTIINPDGVIDFPGLFSFSCHQVVQAGLLGVIPSAQCVPLKSIVFESCGCQDIGEIAPCAICGEGFEVVNENMTVALPGLPVLTCGDLSAGRGLLDPAWCPYLLPFVFEPCGCRRSSFPSCDVCGEGFRVANISATISIEGEQFNCGELEVNGLEGLISPDMCLATSSLVEASCGCQPNECQPFPLCNVCGEGRVIINPEAILSLPGQEESTCAEFADLGNRCLLDPAFCPTSVSAVESVCGCRQATAPISPPPTPSPTFPRPTTLQPIPLPTPISSRCVSDENGNYGMAEGPTAAVEYFYQVEVNQGTTTDVYSNEIAAKMEAAITDVMIPVLFPGECNLSSRRRLQEGVLGIGSSPIDDMVDGVCEGNLANPSNTCFLMRGGATLYTTRAADTATLTEMARKSIEDAMSEGEVNDVDPRVVRVTSRTGGMNGGTGGNNGDNNQRVPPWIWVLIGVGAAVPIVVMAIVCYRRRNVEQSGDFAGPDPYDAYLQEPRATDRFQQEYNSVPASDGPGDVPRNVFPAGFYNNRSGQMRDDSSVGYNSVGGDLGGSGRSFGDIGTGVGGTGRSVGRLLSDVEEDDGSVTEFVA